MRPLQQLPVIGALHARGRLFPAIVALGALALLAQGALHSEPSANTASPPVVQPPPLTLPRLRPNLEKTPLSYWSDYWWQLGDRVRTRIVLIGRESFPALVVAPGLALSSVGAADDFILAERERRLALELRNDGSQEPSAAVPALSPPDPNRLLAVDAEQGVALFEISSEETAEAFSIAEASTLRPGSFLAAVTLSPDRRLRITPSYLVAAHTRPGSVANGDSLELSVPPPPAAAVAIVDLDGELVGMAIEADDGMRLYSSQTILQMMARLQGNRRCHAIEVSDLDVDVRKLLGIRSGVVVERVNWDAFRPEPSIHPGDVLIEWDGRRLSNRWDFHQSYEQQESGKLVRYRLLRGQSVLTGATMMPGDDCRPLGEPLIAFPTLGITVQWGPVPLPEGQPPREGFRVIAVAPGSPAADAGLFIDDWLITAGTRKLTERTARKAFDAFERRPRPLLLSVQRGDRVRLLAVSPPAEQDA